MLTIFELLIVGLLSCGVSMAAPPEKPVQGSGLTQPDPNGHGPARNVSQGGQTPNPKIQSPPTKWAYRDIYLMGDRVCKACRWEWVDRAHVRLVNRAGHAALVSPEEIIGVDRHPVMRRLTLQSLAGVGLPGPIIAPEAYENANDYVCKYCDILKK